MRTLTVRSVPERLRRLGTYLLALTAALAVAILLQEPAHAGESFTWTGEGHDGAWTNSCNWHPKNHCQPTYPGKEATDDQANVTRTPSAPAHVTLGEDITLGSLTLGEGASIRGGSISVLNNFSWTGGTLYTEVALGAGSSGAITGPDLKTLDVWDDNSIGQIHNRGHLSLGSVPLKMQEATKINNLGKFTVAHGAQIEGLNCCLDAPEINNSGELVVSSLLPSPGASTATVKDVTFNAGGTVNVTTGVLELRKAPGEIGPGTNFTGEGKVRITDNAKLKMLGGFTVTPMADIELDSCSDRCGRGALTGTGTMEGDGGFLWRGGYVDGQLTLGKQTDTIISGPAVKQLQGRIINNGRALLWASTSTAPSGEVLLGQASRFTNNGYFIAGERTNLRGMVCCNADVVATFDSPGYFAVSHVGSRNPGTATVSNLAFRAGGQVYVENRGTLELRQGLGTLVDGMKITGKGTVSGIDEDMKIAGTLNIEPGATLELSSVAGDTGQSHLTGRGTLQGGGLFLWTGGVVARGTHLTIAEDNTVQLEGSAVKDLYGILINRGLATLVSEPPPAPASGPLRFLGPVPKFVNEGTFRATDRSVLRGNGCCADPAYFVNTGTFEMSEPFNTSTGTVSVSDVVFENHGTVELASGRLLLGAGGYTQFSGSTRLTGGRIQTGPALFIHDGTLAGEGTITGNLYNTGGVVAPGEPGTAGSTGIINVVGNYRQQAEGILNIDLKGSTAGRGFDQLRVTKQAALDGILDLDTASTYTPGLTTRLKVLMAGQRLGTFDRGLKDPQLPNGREWFAIYRPLDVTLGARRAG